MRPGVCTAPEPAPERDRPSEGCQLLVRPNPNYVGVKRQGDAADRLEYVLKKFRRQITKAGLFQDMKRKRFYESPGALRRRKDKAAARRKVKSARRREQH